MKLETPTFAVEYKDSVAVYWEQLGLSLTYNLQKNETGKKIPAIDKLLIKDGNDTFVVYEDGHKIKRGGQYFNPTALNSGIDKKIFFILSNKLLHSIESAEVSQKEASLLLNRFIKESDKFRDAR
ncbi:MAG: hypothetical protein EOM53_01045 [Alphaproteobacteria bacterium]|nr:hypothetical protein [Alphaproteobacteria bacterium]